MTKHMRTPRPWNAISARERREIMAAFAELSGHQALNDPPPAKKRAKPVAHEAAEQRALTARVLKTAWWAPGYWHIAQERVDGFEAKQLAGRGTKPGWPDVILWIPAVERMKPQGYRLPVRATLELKRPDARPKRSVPERWWISWRPEVDPLREEPTRYGLRWSQALALQLAHAVGYDTMVAYGADAAFEWLDAVAGPQPSKLPEGWTR